MYHIISSCLILPPLFEPNPCVCVTDSNRFAKFIWCKRKRIEQENSGVGIDIYWKFYIGIPSCFLFFPSLFSTTTDLRNDNVTKTIHMRIFVNIFYKGSTTEIEMDCLNLAVYEITFSTAIWWHKTKRGVWTSNFSWPTLNFCHIPRKKN